MRRFLWSLLFLPLAYARLAAQVTFSPAAQALVHRAFADLPPDRPLVDVHAHLVGNGRGPYGIEVHPRLLGWRHPLDRAKALAYLAAAGVPDDAHFDDAYVEKLMERARGFGHPLRIHLLAMDRNYRPDGTPDPAHTEFYVPNERVVALAGEHPDLFVPVVSVNPNRPDALEELGKWAARGVRFLKWLPNAQGIDPSDPRHDRFYDRLRELRITLLTHAGEEQAVKAKEAQALGNPLRLRRPLDHGVTVIVAHCASLGTNEDLDHPGRRASNFELFLRLMDEPNYRGRLFGDISALTQINRLPDPLLAVLRRPDLQARLVNGSDYPLPGVNAIIWTRYLALKGLITWRERRALNEIFRANPLLFDFVLKRTLRDPETGARLLPSVFLGLPG